MTTTVVYRLRLRVQDQPCATCIYGPASGADLARLDAAIADPDRTGRYTRYQPCVLAPRREPVCCRGFWDRHKDDFDGGELAQHLGIVRFVEALRVQPRIPQRKRKTTKTPKGHIDGDA